mgnify:CR=1 FL=1
MFESVDQMFSDAVDILLSELGLWKDCPMYLSVNNHCNVGFTESMVLLESAAKQIEKEKLNFVDVQQELILMYLMGKAVYSVS